MREEETATPDYNNDFHQKSLRRKTLSCARRDKNMCVCSGGCDTEVSTKSSDTQTLASTPRHSLCEAHEPVVDDDTTSILEGLLYSLKC